MGVIQRQSLKYSIVNVVGLAIGTLSTLFIYPHVLEETGLMRFLLDSGMVLLPLLCLGANILTIRYFPRFEDKASGNHGFLALILGLTFAGFCVFSILTLAFKAQIEGFYADKTPLLRQFLHFTLPVAFFYVLNQVLFVYSANYKRIVVPSILTEFSLKIILPVLLFLVWQKWISVESACYGLVLHGAFVSLGLIFYLKWLGAWQVSFPGKFLSPELKKEMFRYGIFGVVGGIGLLIASRVDILMVGSLKTLEMTGIFAIAAQIAAVIEIPIKGLYSASVGTVSRHLEHGEIGELETIYKKVSINLLVVGLLLFFAIWVSLESLFQILPNGEVVAAGRWVFFFIGLSRIVEMTTGMNNAIVYYSKHYAWSLLSLPLTAALTIGLNLWLIPKLGISGAAIATCVSIAFYNAFSVCLVWWKFGIQPFSRKTFLAVLLGVGAYFLAEFIPKTGNDWLDILLRSGAFVAVFGFLAFRFRVSPDLNEIGLTFAKRWVFRKQAVKNK